MAGVADVLFDDQGRPQPPLGGDEAGTLTGFLDFQRATLEWKTRGLSDEQLRVSIDPTSMTLGGLLKHMAYVETTRSPRQSPVSRAPRRGPTSTGRPTTTGNGTAPPRTPATTCGHSGRDGSSGPAAPSPAHWSRTPTPDLPAVIRPGAARPRCQLRWVLVHMIEEYARHNGHADLLRQSIDGETGE